MKHEPIYANILIKLGALQTLCGKQNCQSPGRVVPRESPTSRTAYHYSFALPTEVKQPAHDTAAEVQVIGTTDLLL